MKPSLLLLASAGAALALSPLIACEPSCEDLLDCGPYGGDGGAGGSAGASSSAAGGSGGLGGSGGTNTGCGDGIVTAGEICLSGPPTQTTVAGTDLVTEIRTADCDGDDDVDILVLGTADPLGNSSIISAHRNNGNGDFTNVVTTSLAAPLPMGMVVGDFDGLGQVDVAIPFSPMLNQFLQTYAGDGSCTFTLDKTVQLGAFAQSISTGFFDGDGTEDLVVAVGFPTALKTYMSFGTDQSITTSTIASSLLSGLFNNDATVDLAYLSEGQIVVRAGNAGTFGAESSFTVAGGPTSGPAHLAAGDMDGDNITDLVVAHLNTNSVSVMKNDGNGSFSYLSEVATSSAEPAFVSLGDVDNDGDLDVLASNRKETTLSLLLNDGTGIFSLSTVSKTIQFASPVDVDGFARGARLVDLNKDGASDILFVYQPSTLPGRLYVLLAKP